MYRLKCDVPVVTRLSQHSSQGTAGKRCQVTTNCFRLQLKPGHFIYQYKYVIDPPAKNLEEEEWVLRRVWPTLQKDCPVFFMRLPSFVFMPREMGKELKIPVPEDTTLGYAAHKVEFKLFQTFSSDQFNTGFTGDAQVVANHVVKKLLGAMMYQKVGRRYFTNSDTGDGKHDLAVLGGFFASINNFMKIGSPQLQIDTVYRVLHKQPITDLMESILQGDTYKFGSDEVRDEWRRRCLRSTVVTTYNNRVYSIKALHFDLTPQATFSLYQREFKTSKPIHYTQYYKAYYNTEIHEVNQPLLEAYAEKDSERVFLVPELCSLTGFTEELRKDKNLVTEAFRLTKVSPQDRHAAILQVADEVNKASKTSQNPIGDWNFTLDARPLEVEARVFEPLEVNFGSKKFAMEEGNFQRWMRNGLQCPTKLDEWLFIYPESDTSVLDIWLRSLRDIAQVAFTMKMADPEKHVCDDQRENIEKLLLEKVKPTTQMVLLLTPQKDARAVYQIFKKTTCVTRPCITQVVKSETIRKRQSIASILSRIVLQINAKFCGPLWHVEVESSVTKPLFHAPTMVIGVDTFVSNEGKIYMGFTASLDTQVSEYYSTACKLDEGNEDACMSKSLQEAFRDALVQFARRNDHLLPHYILVYRASANPEDWFNIRHLEIEGLLAVLRHIGNRKEADHPGEAEWQPKLTFVCIAKRTAMRFFVHTTEKDEHVTKNPEPGTVVDSPVVTAGTCPNFYLINQAVPKGSSSPTHYSIIHDSTDPPLSANAVQAVSHKLSFMYFNFTGSVRLPAPAQYARKIAHLVGTAVKERPHKRLSKTFFYL